MCSPSYKAHLLVNPSAVRRLQKFDVATAGSRRNRPPRSRSPRVGCRRTPPHSPDRLGSRIRRIATSGLGRHSAGTRRYHRPGGPAFPFCPDSRYTGIRISAYVLCAPPKRRLLAPSPDSLMYPLCWGLSNEKEAGDHAAMYCNMGVVHTDPPARYRRRYCKAVFTVPPAVAGGPAPRYATSPPLGMAAPNAAIYGSWGLPGGNEIWRVSGLFGWAIWPNAGDAESI